MYYCLQEMDKIGVDMFVDVHGDEEIPMNFVSGMLKRGLNFNATQAPEASPKPRRPRPH